MAEECVLHALGLVRIFRNAKGSVSETEGVLDVTRVACLSMFGSLYWLMSILLSSFGSLWHDSAVPCSCSWMPLGQFDHGNQNI